MGIKKIASIFNRGFDNFIAAMASIAGAFAVILMVIVTIDVLLAFFFNKPTEWISEISCYMLVFIPFLTGAWILKNDGHVRMEFLIDRLKGKNKAALSLILYIIIAGICGMIIYYGIMAVMTAFKMKLLTPTLLAWPKWPLLVIVPFGFILLFIQALRSIVGQAEKIKQSGDADKSLSK
jgi:TRAP-type C4-dicarboxylate transport system permease small subunit